MSGNYISLFNGTSVLTDQDIINIIPDLQAQVANEFNYFWGLSAYIDFAGAGAPMILVDYPGQNDPAGALGYHSIDANYQPYAVVFVALCNDDGVPWAGVVSHETLEMLADLQIDTTAYYSNGDGSAFLVYQEVCDPCESSYYYGVNGTILSDFITPAWLQPGNPNQVDLLGACGGPWVLASGGYVSYELVYETGWQAAFGARAQQTQQALQQYQQLSPEQVVAKIAADIQRRVQVGGNPRIQLVKQLQRQAATLGRQQGQGAGAAVLQQQGGGARIQQRQGRAQQGRGIQSLAGGNQATQQAQQQNQQEGGPLVGHPRVQGKPQTKPVITAREKVTLLQQVAQQAQHQPIGAGGQQVGGRTTNGSSD